MSLPIDDIFESLLSSVRVESRTILQAPPGAGKSTRLPLLLLQSGFYSNQRQIIMLEPRRVAARQIAHYLAQQLNESVGESVGLVMRGERKVSNKTALTIMTDGVFVRMLQDDPELAGISLVIFDEFHERALMADLGLALALESQMLNESLKLLIMSATLDSEQLASSLDANIIVSQGRQFPIEVKYVSGNTIPTTEDILRAISQAWSEQTSSILVFLPGIKEIKQLQEWLEEKQWPNCQVLPLYGGLSIQQQVQAIAPSPKGFRKIVLATNIAQTSLTIEDVDTVVDAGVERIVSWNNKFQQEVLSKQLISKAAAIQRAGRAGRLRAGVCYRIGEASQFERRREFDVAEIERVELTELLLEVKLWGSEFDDLYWQSIPPQSLLDSAKNKLLRLAFLSNQTSGLKLTQHAQNYAKYGVGIRFTKMMAQAEAAKNETTICSTALLIAYLEVSPNKAGNLLSVLHNNMGPQTTQIVSRAEILVKRMGGTRFDKLLVDDQEIIVALSYGYADRIAMKKGKQWKVADGSGGQFPLHAVEPNQTLLFVCQANVSDKGQYISSYVPFELAMLEQSSIELVESEDVVIWSEQKQGPQKLRQQKLNKLVLSEQVLPLEITQQDWQRLWCDYIVKTGWSIWKGDSIAAFLKKLQLIAEHVQDFNVPKWSADSLLEELRAEDNWLTPYLSHVKQVKQLAEIDIVHCLLQRLEWNIQQKIQTLCPSHYQTPAGHNRVIDYASSPPKISVKLQEMFGEPESPAICQGNVKLQIELLSPAQRPLQITQDLHHFWKNAYIEVKKEMKGRYPKHPWPDDPVNFVATTKTKKHLK